MVQKKDMVQMMDTETAREILQIEQQAKMQKETEALRVYCKKRGIQLVPLITLGPRGVVQSQIQIVFVNPDDRRNGR